MNLPIGAAYLIETSYDDVGALRVFDGPGLTGYLTKNMEDAHYSGEADAVHGIYKYVSPGHLSELILVHIGDSTTDDDYMHCRYRLHEKAAAEAFGVIDDNKVLEFTLRIDGRS